MDNIGVVKTKRNATIAGLHCATLW